MSAARYPGGVTARTPAPLGLGARVRMRGRHGWRLAGEVRRYASQQRLWWLVPMITVIVLVAMAITTTSSALPVAVYTLF